MSKYSNRYYNQSLKYHKLQILKNAIEYRHLDDKDSFDGDDQISSAWYCVYENCLNNINRSQNIEYIDMMKFTARYALRQMQLLGCVGEFRKTVEHHYWIIRVEKAALEISENQKIIEQGLKFKLNNIEDRYEKLNWWCEEKVNAELSKLGYDIDKFNTQLYGTFGEFGKYRLRKNIDEAYEKLDFWISRPANGATTQTLNLEDSHIRIFERDNSSPYENCTKIKNKDKYVVLEFVFEPK